MQNRSTARIQTARTLTAAAIIASAAVAATAQPVQIQVTVENLAPTNSVSFAGLRLAFNNGTYDSFNNGEAATAPIISIAEAGNGAAWFSAFAAADPTATLGSVLPSPAGPLLPGRTGTAVFEVDASVNQFFTFGAMVVPSNDYFLGNDSPTQYRILDADGNLLINSITQRGRDIWDAGSELDGPFGSAFLQGSTGSDRIDQNGVVRFDFEGLDIFNGLTTAAGYTFDRQFGANDAIYRISFAVVPAPGVVGTLGLAGLMAARRRRA